MSSETVSQLFDINGFLPYVPFVAPILLTNELPVKIRLGFLRKLCTAILVQFLIFTTVLKFSSIFPSVFQFSSKYQVVLGSCAIGSYIILLVKAETFRKFSNTCLILLGLTLIQSVVVVFYFGFGQMVWTTSGLAAFFVVLLIK